MSVTGGYNISSGVQVWRIVDAQDIASGATFTSRRFPVLGAKAVHLRCKADAASTATALTLAPLYFLFTDTAAQADPADVNAREIQMAVVIAEMETTGHLATIIPDANAGALEFQTGTVLGLDSISVEVPPTGGALVDFTMDAVVQYA